MSTRNHPLGIALAIAAAALLACSDQRRAPAPAIVGTYLVSPGDHAMVISPGESGTLRVEHLPDNFLMHWKAKRQGDQSVIVSMGFNFGPISSALGMGDGSEDIDYVPFYRIRPSTTTPGDWDLVSLYHEKREIAIPPVPGYFHRIEQSSAERFFKIKTPDPERGNAKWSPEEWEAILAAARVFLAEDEAHPARRVIYLDVLLESGRFTEFREQFTAWRSELASHPNATYRQMATIGDMAIRGEAHPESSDALIAALAPDAELATRALRIKALRQLDEYVPRPRMLLSGPSVPNFLDAQTTAKCLATESIFAAMLGEQEEAVALAAGVYRMGQCFERGETLISGLIGVALRAIAAGRLEMHALNTCDTPEELEMLSGELERLDAWTRVWSEKDLADAHPAELRLVLGFNAKADNPPVEAQTRGRYSNALLQNVRAAAAARHRFLSTGKWPASPAEFGPLLAGGPPLDPFADVALLWEARGGDFVVWSRGPDGDDDRAAVRYDPSNGTISNGDVYTEIPAVRRYPFPRDGFRPRTTADVERQFPHGLPADLFADTRGRPLTVHPGEPPVIFSFGPDVDEREYLSEPTPAEAWLRSEPQYDPTNGTISNGNLYYRW